MSDQVGTQIVGFLMHRLMIFATFEVLGKDLTKHSYNLGPTSCCIFCTVLVQNSLRYLNIMTYEYM